MAVLKGSLKEARFSIIAIYYLSCENAKYNQTFSYFKSVGLHFEEGLAALSLLPYRNDPVPSCSPPHVGAAPSPIPPHDQNSP